MRSPHRPLREYRVPVAPGSFLGAAELKDPKGFPFLWLHGTPGGRLQGVQGKWGSGKTSLMRYAMARIGGVPLGAMLRTSQQPSYELPDSLYTKWQDKAQDADTRLHTALTDQLAENLRGRLQVTHVHLTAVWFNPWQHQGSQTPLAALLQEIRSQLTFRARLADGAKKIAQVSLEAGLPMIGELIDSTSKLLGGPSTGMAGIIGKIRGVGDDYEQRNFEALSDAQRSNLLFEQAIARVLGEDVAKERGEPPWLDEKGREVPMRRLVIFVDDLDRCSEDNVVQLLEAIKLYLQTRYCVFVLGMDSAAVRRAVQARLPGSSAENAQEYLEKLFQATVHVPISRDRKRFVAGLVEGAELPKECVPLLDELLEPNPRKAKNFVNSLAVAWKTCETADEYIEPFVLVHYLKLYHPDVCRLLTYDPQHIETLHSVLVEDAILPKPNASAVRLLFRSAFRHAFDVAPIDSPTDVEQSSPSCTNRLDRHRGDRAFITAWTRLFKDAAPSTRDAQLVPALVAEGVS